MSELQFDFNISSSNHIFVLSSLSFTKIHQEISFFFTDIYSNYVHTKSIKEFLGCSRIVPACKSV